MNDGGKGYLSGKNRCRGIDILISSRAETFRYGKLLESLGLPNEDLLVRLTTNDNKRFVGVSKYVLDMTLLNPYDFDDETRGVKCHKAYAIMKKMLSRLVYNVPPHYLNDDYLEWVGRELNRMDEREDFTSERLMGFEQYIERLRKHFNISETEAIVIMRKNLKDLNDLLALRDQMKTKN